MSVSPLYGGDSDVSDESNICTHQESWLVLNDNICCRHFIESNLEIIILSSSKKLFVEVIYDMDCNIIPLFPFYHSN